MTNAALQEETLLGGWKWVKLRDVCLTTKTTDPTKTPNSAFTYIDISSIDRSTKTISNPSLMLGKDAPSRARRVVHTGDVMVSTTRPNLNAVALVDGQYDGQVCSTGICVLRPDRDRLDPGYLYLYVRTDDFVDSVSGKTQGAMYPAITDKQVLDQDIPLPPLADQKRIVRILNGQLAAIERAKKAAEQRLEAARALREAFVLRAFRTSSTCPWPKRTLLELCEGKGQYGTSKKSNFNGVGVPVLGMGNIREGRVAWDDIKHTELSASELVKFRLRRGDLLFNRTNSAELVGKSAVYNDHVDAGFASYLIRFKIHPEWADSRFVCTYINSPQGRTFIRDNLAQAVGQANISASTMHGMLVPTPPLQQQIELSDLLEVVDSETFRLRSAMQSDIWDLDSTTAALLRRAFSGAIE